MYNIKAVSTMLDIPATTIRAWEIRYGAIAPLRSPSGYRQYAESDVEDLRWLKEQTESQGVSISQAVKQLRQLKQEQGELPRAPEPQMTLTFDRLVGQICEALAAYRIDRANWLLEIGFSVFDYQDMFYRVLGPLMQRVGDERKDGRLSAAQEHLASQFVAQRFFQFFRLFPVDESLPRVLALCPPGEHQQIGLLLFTLFLRQQHAEVLYLGPNTPADGLQELIAAMSIQIVSMSVTREENVPSCLHMIECLSGRFPRLRFVLGGQGASRLGKRLQRCVIGPDRDTWPMWFERNMKKSSR